MKTGKHVIFLGAGASCGSGYPLANELRLLISSRKKWWDALMAYEGEHGIRSQLAGVGLPYWDKHAEALELFRYGAFATIDEFCKLAGNKFQSEINGLRCFMRAALGLFNPEDHFEKSEYYSFVQALFKEDLESLRNDVTVLTYNYDPYLEFLLFRALDRRYRIRRKGLPPYHQGEETKQLIVHENALCAVTSGFDAPNNLKWLEDDKTTPTFCVLKLHGSICFRLDETGGFENLFSSEPNKRAQALFQGKSDAATPPVLFPWEMMTDRGFAGRDSALFQHFGSMYPLFRGIWERARREVLAADKISFIGLSMHPFLFDGLKYLFEGRKGKVEVCIANPENTAFVHGRSETHWNSLPSSPAYKLADILRKAAPGMGWSGYALPKKRDDGDMTLISDFSTFIRKQMAPIVLE